MKSFSKTFINIKYKSNTGKVYRSFSSHSICKVDNPYTQEIHIEKPFVSSSNINTFIENSGSASSFLKAIDIDERIRLVNEAMNWFKKNKVKVATEISNSMGKPYNQALNEIDGMIGRSNALCELCREALADDVIKVDSENLLKIKKEPVGISFMISPWNYPLLTVINALAASILSGNPVLLKHSVKTPIIGDFFEEAFNSVGGTNVVQHLFLDGKDIRSLYNVESINYVGFTGSVDTGRLVLSNIAESHRFVKSTFELGGKDSAYVRDDANVKFAAESIVDGAMYNSGQGCCSIERVYVHEKIHDEFISYALEEVKKLTLGNPIGWEKESKEIQYPSNGPMALADSIFHIKDQIEKAGEAGAEVIYGGNITTDSKGKGRFFEPTLILNCDNSMDIIRKETFGPVLPVIKVSNDNEAIELMNDSEYGLTSAIYSNDYKKAEKLGEQLNTGTVYLNRCDNLNPYLPWSGRKNSGVGVSLSRYGFESFYRLKSYNYRILSNK